MESEGKIFARQTESWEWGSHERNYHPSSMLDHEESTMQEEWAPYQIKNFALRLFQAPKLRNKQLFLPPVWYLTVLYCMGSDKLGCHCTQKGKGSERPSALSSSAVSSKTWFRASPLVPAHHSSLCSTLSVFARYLPARYCYCCLFMAFLFLVCSRGRLVTENLPSATEGRQDQEPPSIDRFHALS